MTVPGGAALVVATLVARGQTLAVAESLTGGLLAATVVDVPGASRAFRGGLVVYATELKASLAGVPVDLLARQGPVDPDVAAALAMGARLRCGADWGLATVQRLALTGSRAAIRAATVAAALDLLATALA